MTQASASLADEGTLMTSLVTTRGEKNVKLSVLEKSLVIFVQPQKMAFDVRHCVQYVKNASVGGEG